MPELLRDNHGTSCAGIVAMAKSNGVCGVGIAYKADIAGNKTSRDVCIQKLLYIYFFFK